MHTSPHRACKCAPAGNAVTPPAARSVTHNDGGSHMLRPAGPHGHAVPPILILRFGREMCRAGWRELPHLMDFLLLQREEIYWRQRGRGAWTRQTGGRCASEGDIIEREAREGPKQTASGNQTVCARRPRAGYLKVGHPHNARKEPVRSSSW